MSQISKSGNVSTSESKLFVVPSLHEVNLKCIRFNNSQACKLTISKFNSKNKLTNILYELELNAGELHIDNFPYFLEEKDCLLAKSNISGTRYTLVGEKSYKYDVLSNKINLQSILNLKLLGTSFIINTKEFIDNYYLLGINFGEFEFNKDFKYTLLIDRYKKKEVRKCILKDEISKNCIKKSYRKAKFYHEVNPEENRRINEILLESFDNIQYFNFNQNNYYNRKENSTGISSGVKNVILGFRLRVEDTNNFIVESSYIGKVNMVINNFIISYKFLNN